MNIIGILSKYNNLRKKEIEEMFDNMLTSSIPIPRDVIERIVKEPKLGENSNPYGTSNDVHIV